MIDATFRNGAIEGVAAVRQVGDWPCIADEPFANMIVDAARQYLAVQNSLELALQLPFLQVSDSMGNHDSEIVDARSVD